MSRASPDYLCATLIRDYLASAASITAGVPADSILPKQIMDSGETRKVPCLAINAAESGDSSGARRVVDVGVLLPYMLKSTDSNAPTDATSTARTISRATASQYMDLIECRLRDTAAFSTYLATLSEDTREGWAILRIRVRQQPAIQREKDQPTNAQTLALAVQFILAWAR